MKNLNKIISLLLCIAVFTALLVGCAGNTQQEGEQRGNSAANTATRTAFAADERYAYYLGGESTEQGYVRTLYRLDRRSDKTESLLEYTGGNISYINLCGKNLYYLWESENERDNAIVFFNTKERTCEEIYNTENKVKYLCFVDGVFYFTEDNQVISFSPESGERKVLYTAQEGEAIKSLNVSQGKACFIVLGKQYDDLDKLVFADTVTGEQVFVFESKRLYHCVLEGDYLYFSTNEVRSYDSEQNISGYYNYSCLARLNLANLKTAAIENLVISDSFVFRYNFFAADSTIYFPVTKGNLLSYCPDYEKQVEPYGIVFEFDKSNKKLYAVNDYCSYIKQVVDEEESYYCSDSQTGKSILLKNASGAAMFADVMNVEIDSQTYQKIYSEQNIQLEANTSLEDTVRKRIDQIENGILEFAGEKIFCGVNENHKVKKLVIPEGTTIIFDARNFYNIESLVIPESVKFIYPGAFNGCTSLKQVTLSPNTKAMFNNVFDDCPIEELVVPEGVEYIFSEGIQGNKLRRVTIPSSVIFIDGISSSCEDFTICCEYGSYAHQWALARDVQYEIIEK